MNRLFCSVDIFDKILSKITSHWCNTFYKKKKMISVKQCSYCNRRDFYRNWATGGHTSCISWAKIIHWWGKEERQKKYWVNFWKIEVTLTANKSDISKPNEFDLLITITRSYKSNAFGKSDSGSCKHQCVCAGLMLSLWVYLAVKCCCDITSMRYQSLCLCNVWTLHQIQSSLFIFIKCKNSWKHLHQGWITNFATSQTVKGSY